MARHNLSKLIGRLTSTATRANLRPMSAGRATLLLTVLLGLAPVRNAAAQAAVASDLWRVAAGTLVVPFPLADDGSAALWTPATALPRPGPAIRFGIETVHAPSDVGISGGIASLGVRVGGLGTLTAVYGRLGFDGLVRTETSPEGIGDIPVYAEVLSLGLAGWLTRDLLAGVAVRRVSGQLDIASRSQVGVDVGVRYAGPSRVTLGFATQFFDPTFRQASQSASYSFGAAYQTLPSPLWGTAAALAFRYGATLSHGEGVQHLASAGLILGSAAELDLGAALENVAGVPAWRSKLGLAVGVGRYRVYLCRDGGVNDFGATYRFGLTAVGR